VNCEIVMFGHGSDIANTSNDPPTFGQVRFGKSRAEPEVRSTGPGLATTVTQWEG
jgi:hypothetical protein